MGYCSVENVKQNHEQIEAIGTADDAAIQQFIADADAIIDGFVRGKVTLPFLSTPPLIQYISKSLATFFELKRVYGAQVSEEVAMFIQTYKDSAFELLEKIAACEINFSTADATYGTVIASNTDGKIPIFDLTDPEGQTYHPTDDDKRYGQEE